MAWSPRSGSLTRVALLAEGVDRNISQIDDLLIASGSPSSRRAWIEIGHPPHRGLLRGVALLAEGVDRNSPRWQKSWQRPHVALLAEGVDRNFI